MQNKSRSKPNHVLRYIGELSGDLQNDKKSRSKISFGAIRYGIGD
jgi:hypothetical protein